MMLKTWWPPPPMSGPPLSKVMMLMARKLDETRRKVEGALGNPGKGGRNDETQKPPRRARVRALGTPIEAAACHF